MKQVFTIILIGISFTAYSQDHHHQEKPNEKQGMMPYVFSRNLPMERKGSGTSWHPDASPMYGYMWHSGNWMFMGHGNLHIRYNNQDVLEAGSRGDEQFDAPNWMMLMGQRGTGQNGQFYFSIMLSLDPLTVGGAGYPLLFQTGETWQGRPLIDRQHPHNFFSELAIGYSHMINSDMDVFTYLAYPGEPSIGPPAFMHRPSSLDNPDAPLGHHWQDATHIIFGVATAGIRYGKFKLESSVFTGREPGEDRWGFDPPKFDSYSARLSFNPSENYALQLSRAFLKSPEVITPGIDVNRTTASLLYARPAPGNSSFTTALVWGLNEKIERHSDHSFLAEAGWRLNRTGIYGRYEWIEKDAFELGIFPAHHEVHNYWAQSLTLGINYTFLEAFNTWFMAGVQGSVLRTRAELRSPVFYGEWPVSAQVYLRVSPALMGSARHGI